MLKGMHILIVLAFVVTAMSCANSVSVSNGSSTPISKANSVVGSWKIMGMVSTPLDIEKVTETTLLGGSTNFNADGTFDGEITYPKTPGTTIKQEGTYVVEDDVITISNTVSHSTMKSTIKFEKDVMILTPSKPDAFIAYYKRLD